MNGHYGKLEITACVLGGVRAGNSSISGTEFQERGKERAKMLGKCAFRVAYVWTRKFQKKKLYHVQPFNDATVSVRFKAPVRTAL